MPCPFPGLDPFLEGQVWREFHTHFIGELQVQLAPLLRPRYVVRMEEDLIIEDAPEPEPPPRPDVVVAERRGGAAVAVASTAPSNQAPFTIPAAFPTSYRQRYLEVRLRSDERVVVVIELLSPTNKRRFTRGRSEYLRKRERLYAGPAHVVELDLLRGGSRLPMARPLPPGDYYVIVSRSRRRPNCDVWPVGLREPLPSFSVPLLEVDESVDLDLQATLTSVYERVGYEHVLDYAAGVVPPLDADDAEWAAQCIATAAR